jgi:hypothetical protein
MRNATKLLALLLVAAWALPAEAQFTEVWERSQSNGNLPTWFGSTNAESTERGFAYGMVGGNERVLVVSRKGGTDIHVINALTGLDELDGSLNPKTLDMTGVSGGVFLLNDVGVTDDGIIIACNLRTTLAGSPFTFKCYSWANEDASPVTSLNYGDSSFETSDGVRVGDKIAVEGSCADNSAMIWAPAAAANTLVYKFETDDNCATFDATADTPIALNNADGTPSATINTNGNTPDVAPLSDGSFYLTGSGIEVRYFGADGDYAGSVSTGVVAAGKTAIKAFSVGARDFLLVHSFTDNNAQLVEVTGGLGSAVSLGTTDDLGSNTSTNGTGDVDFKVDGSFNLTVYDLETNNGLGAFTFNPALPVELTSFTALTEGNSVTLAWETASEVNNDGFSVEHFQSGAFAEVGYVAGYGTTLETQSYGFTVADLEPGSHRFRLKQMDYDGAFSYSPEVEVSVGVEGAFALSAPYPNPFAETATFSLTVKTAQHVEVAAFDLLGRQVATLYNGTVEAGLSQALTFAATDLPSGMYVIRAQGETFAGTQRVTVAR